MSEKCFLAVAGTAIALCLWAGFAVVDAGKPHDRCVEARRIEVVVGIPARKCPPIGWWNEPNGHTDADHG